MAGVMSPRTPDYRTPLARTAAGALLGATGLTLASPAEAAFAHPRFYGCNDWGPGASSITMRNRPANTSRSSAYRSARSIQATHFNRGWIDTDQHYGVHSGAIHGRPYLASHECPGERLYKKLPNLRREVHNRLVAAS